MTKLTNFKKTNKIIESSLMTDYTDKKFYTPHISTMNLLDGSMDFSGKQWENDAQFEVIDSSNVNESNYIKKANMINCDILDKKLKIDKDNKYIFSFDVLCESSSNIYIALDLYNHEEKIIYNFSFERNCNKYERIYVKINRDLFLTNIYFLSKYDSGKYFLSGVEVFSSGGLNTIQDGFYFRKPMLTRSDFQTAYFPSVNDLLKIKQQKKNK